MSPTHHHPHATHHPKIIKKKELRWMFLLTNGGSRTFRRQRGSWARWDHAAAVRLRGGHWAKDQQIPAGLLLGFLTEYKEPNKTERNQSSFFKVRWSEPPKKFRTKKIKYTPQKFRFFLNEHVFFLNFSWFVFSKKIFFIYFLDFANSIDNGFGQRMWIETKPNLEDLIEMVKT